MADIAMFNTLPLRATPVAVRRITTRDLRDVLAAGWRDFLTIPTQLVFLCILYPIVGLVAARAAVGMDLLPLLFPLVAGIALLGPVMAVGVYELSRRREQGLASSWLNAFDVLRSRAIFPIALSGVALLVVFMLWLSVAAVIYRNTVGLLHPDSAGAFIQAVFGTAAGWQMIVLGNLAGLVFSAFVLAISAVSVPMLLDRPATSPLVAMQTSLRAIQLNPVVMAIWGLIVAAMLVLGCIPLFIGLAVVMPVLGHATWHLYRRVVV